MAHVISVHSFRGGTGKSNTTANLAAIYAKKGLRVGIIDTDIQSPGIHILFCIDEGDVHYTLNDYLWRRCTIEQVTYDVTQSLGEEVRGKVFLTPSSVNPSDIARILHDGYDVNLLSQGFNELLQALKLDVLIIDTHPGLNEETLLSIALSSAVLVVMRPDHQDYQGTGLTVEVARELEVPNLMILVNNTPDDFDSEQIKEMVEEAYSCPVAAVIKHSSKMMTLASHGLFSMRYPDDPTTLALEKVADALISH